MGLGYDPFDVGLHFGGWLYFHIASEALAGKPNFSNEANLAAATEKSYRGYHSRSFSGDESRRLYFAIGGTSVSLPLISSKADFSAGLMCG